MKCTISMAAIAALAISSTAYAGAHKSGGHNQIGQYSGFEGNGEVLGAEAMVSTH